MQPHMTCLWIVLAQVGLFTAQPAASWLHRHHPHAADQPPAQEALPTLPPAYHAICPPRTYTRDGVIIRDLAGCSFTLAPESRPPMSVPALALDAIPMEHDADYGQPRWRRLSSPRAPAYLEEDVGDPLSTLVPHNPRDLDWDPNLSPVYDADDVWERVDVVVHRSPQAGPSYPPLSNPRAYRHLPDPRRRQDGGREGLYPWPQTNPAPAQGGPGPIPPCAVSVQGPRGSWPRGSDE
jgi:hypothetical protein